MIKKFIPITDKELAKTVGGFSPLFIVETVQHGIETTKWVITRKKMSPHPLKVGG